MDGFFSEFHKVNGRDSHKQRFIANQIFRSTKLHNVHCTKNCDADTNLVGSVVLFLYTVTSADVMVAIIMKQNSEQDIGIKANCRKYGGNYCHAALVASLDPPSAVCVCAQWGILA